MMKPTVHLNGTSRSELIEQVETALRGIEVALDAVQVAAPNGRDYYPQGDHAYQQAALEHAARVERLHAIKAEYEALARHLVDLSPGPRVWIR